MKWKIGGATEDEGWKIITENEFIQGDLSEPAESEWIATVYDRVNAEYIVLLHNESIDNERKMRVIKL